MTKMQVTAEEKNAITSLRKLEAAWPDSLWLFSADGKLYVMRRGEDGNRAYKPFGENFHGGGGVDPHYILETINIPSDGGDW